MIDFKVYYYRVRRGLRLSWETISCTVKGLHTLMLNPSFSKLGYGNLFCTLFAFTLGISSPYLVRKPSTLLA